jgi:hypothetical protein
VCIYFSSFVLPCPFPPSLLLPPHTRNSPGDPAAWAAWHQSPLPAAPSVAFSVHTLPVVDVCAHAGLGLAVSMANDGFSTELAVYSMRRQKFLRVVRFPAPVRQPDPFRGRTVAEGVALRRVVLSPLGYIVAIGATKSSAQRIWLLSVNGKLLQV